MRVHFSANGWADYCHWIQADLATVTAINRLIADIRQTPHKGLGKPEPLRGDLAGWWSRGITAEHRLVYTVEGVRGLDQRVSIMQCRYHY